MVTLALSMTSWIRVGGEASYGSFSWDDFRREKSKTTVGWEVVDVKRRDFLAAGIGASVALPVFAHSGLAEGENKQGGPGSGLRALFPRLQEETYLNAAGLMPLGEFARAGLERYLEWQTRGGRDGRDEYRREAIGGVRSRFARLVGAKTSEIGLVHCTKAGEQIVLDSVPGLKSGGNVVTNDLHFSGSLHNLVGLKRAGLDVRIVRGRSFTTDLSRMEAAIDDKTAVVSVTLVSNVNGHVEEMKKIAEIAHTRGAIVYADIIQAAGIVPLDVHQLGIDIAACSCYKWLFGTYGTGFVFVRQGLQGTEVADRLFPGSARHNYAPWVEKADGEWGDFVYRAPEDARRYQPGHVNYAGYCAVYEGLRFLEKVGVQRALDHSIALNRRLYEKIDRERYPCISPHRDRSPIVSFLVEDTRAVRRRLEEERIAVSLGSGRIRVSPGVYNDEGDIDRLAEVLGRV